MSLTFPPPGRLSYIPEPYRVVRLTPGQEFKIPPNVDAVMGDHAFTLKYPGGPDIVSAAPPEAPIAIEAMWPKGTFIYSAGAGGTTNLKLYSYT